MRPSVSPRGTDAISRFLQRRTEDPHKVQEYIREMFYRDSAGLDQVEPEIWFNAPKGWRAPHEAEQIYQQLSGDTDHAAQVEQAAPTEMAGGLGDKVDISGEP